MHIVFQGETGKDLLFSLAHVPATSGFIDVVAQERSVHRFMGTISGVYLTVSPSGVSNLAAGNYIVLPHVFDVNSKLYFLDATDLQIINVPPVM